MFPIKRSRFVQDTYDFGNITAVAFSWENKKGKPIYRNAIEDCEEKLAQKYLLDRFWKYIGNG